MFNKLFNRSNPNNPQPSQKLVWFRNEETGGVHSTDNAETVKLWRGSKFMKEIPAPKKAK